MVLEAFSDGPLVLQADEVADAWWWTPDELGAHLAESSWPIVPETRGGW